MKRVIVLSLFLIIFSFGFSQKRNNIWMIGGTFPNDNMGIDFNSGSADTFFLYRDMGFFLTNSGICDTNGQLLFYTNGDYIANRFHQRLLNSTNFNPTITGDTVYGLNINQATVNLPYPGRDSLFILFHVNAEYFTANAQAEYEPLELRYSIIDLKLDNTLGGIDTNHKSVVTISDTLTLGRITACKHANGRDWWIIVHRYFSDIYYKILLTPDTLIISNQAIGSIVGNDILGEAVFSFDGEKYAMSSPDHKLDLFDFDRCTGIFSNAQLITVPDTGLGTLGCAFSLSGRYLYVCNNLHVFQYDTWAANISGSVVIVASWDSTLSLLATTFFMMNLAPDNKIYITTYQGTNVLHVINYPDSPGLTCNLVQHGLILPSYNAFSLPNAVNYYLGPVIGSVCDSLPHVGLPFLSATNNILSLSPNPAQYIITLNAQHVSGKTATISVFNLLGETVWQKQTSVYNGGYVTQDIYLNNFSKGVYIVKLQTEKENLMKKFVRE